MTKTLPRIAITAGEPAGIGLDLCVMLARQTIPAEIVIIADQNALLNRAKERKYKRFRKLKYHQRIVELVN